MPPSLSPVSKTAIAVALIGAALQPVAAAAEETALAAADDQQTGRIVVTATRAPRLQEEVPATVTVLEAEDIADILATDVRDMVRFEPGVSVRRAPARFGAALGSTGRGRNEDIVIRGIGGNRVLIQVDGIRAPQGFAFGAQSAGRGDYADVSLVKSVEILRGPASALYGSDGLAGAVSFVTNDPADILRGNAIGGFVTSLYASEDNQFANTAVLAGKTGNLSAMVAYTRRDFNELENKGTNDGTGPARTVANPQDGSSDAVLAKLVWEDGAHRLRVTGEYLGSAVSTELLQAVGPVSFGGPPLWQVDQVTARDTVGRKRASVDWTYTGSSDDWIEHAFVTAFWQDGTNRQFADERRTALGRTPAPDRLRINSFDNEVYGGLAEFRSSFSFGGIDNSITFGGDVSWTRQTGLRDGTFPPAGEVFPTAAFPATDFMLGGIFLGNEMKLFDGVVTLFPALRFDFFDLNPDSDPTLPASFRPAAQSGNRLTPKLGATIRVTPSVFLYGNYSQGFLAPTPGQINQFFENLLGAQPYTSVPNPGLRPENSRSWELGARYVGDMFSLQVAAFRGDYEDFITQEVTGGSFIPADPAVFQFVNFQNVRIEGLEARAEMKLDNGLTGRMTFAYAQGDVIDAGGARFPLLTIDPFNLIAGLGYRAPSGRFGGEFVVTYNARKENAAVPRQNGAAGPALFVPPASTFVDLVAFVNVTDNLKLRGGLFNITNEKVTLWQDVLGLPLSEAGIADAFTRPGRNFSLSASYRF